MSSLFAHTTQHGAIEGKTQETKIKIDKIKEELLNLETSGATEEVTLLSDKKEVEELQQEIDKLQKELLFSTTEAEKLNSFKLSLDQSNNVDYSDEQLNCFMNGSLF